MYNINVITYARGFKPHVPENLNRFFQENKLGINLVNSELIRIFKDHNIYKNE